MPRNYSRTMVEALISLLGPERVATSGPEVTAASRDESDMAPVMPIAVAKPKEAWEVSAIVRLAIRHEVPLTARGGGTSLEGSSIPSPGAVVVDFSAMDLVVDLVPEEQRVTVGPGMVYERLNRLLRPHGLFFPPSPGGSSDVATIGGMVSTDASGIYALKYGGTRRWVLALDVVTGRGDAMRVGSIVPKTSAGYDLKDLFVGAEGTLGLITSVTLRLAPIPIEARRSAFWFDDLAGACATAAELAAFVPEIAAEELCDAETLDLLRGQPGFESLPSGHALFIEVHGRAQDCDQGLQAACEVAASHQGRVFSLDHADPWEVRHRITGVIREAARPFGVIRTDCAVPLQRLGDFVMQAKTLAARRGKTLHVFGHVGLGIVHVLMPLAGPGAWNRDEALDEKRRLAEAAVLADGTISGEHGIGLGLREFLVREHPTGISYMKGVKALFDPHAIMNPGKVLPGA